MSTQYNSQQGPYDELRKTTIAIVERVNVREIVLPFISGASVLDLACGTGFYSRSFLQWGATKVVGVDISSAMIQEAQALSRNHGDAIDFILADGSTPTKFPGGPFDLVFGAWFLNYAADKAEMVVYYKNILLNLKPGGRFVGVTPPPTNDPRGTIEKEGVLRPLPSASGGLYTTVTGQIEDGVTMHLHKDTVVGDLDFDCYHLRKEVWEVAAQEAGLKGELRWRVTDIPKDFMSDPGRFGEEDNGGAGDEELKTYGHLPHYGLLSIERKPSDYLRILVGV